MDKNQVRLALLKIVLLVTIGTTWVFSSFIFASRPEESETDPLTALVRLPASLPSQLPAQLPGVFQASSHVNDPIEMEVVRVPCWDKSEPEDNETSSRWVRLTGRRCQVELNDGAEPVSVRNLTTGYAATVFPTRGRELTTDFIPLQAGKNDIVIRFEQDSGEPVENQFSFVRE